MSCASVCRAGGGRGRRLNFLPLFSPSSFLPRPPPKMIVPCPARSAGEEEEEEEGPPSSPAPVRPSCLSVSHSPPILGAFLRHSSSSRDGNISRRRRRGRRRRRRRRQSQSFSPPRAWTMAATTKVSFSHMHKDKTKRGGGGGGGSAHGALVYRAAVRFGHFRSSPFLFFRRAPTSVSPSDCLRRRPWMMPH